MRSPTNGHGKATRLDPTPVLGQRGKVIQEYGKVIHMPIGVADDARQKTPTA